MAFAPIELAGKMYGARIENFCVVMGPHIRECCYTVDEERAKYFRVNFTPDCVSRVSKDSSSWSLSLLKANLAVLREALGAQ